MSTKSDGFTRNAALYANSPAHAETADLDLALPALGDLDGRTLLDVATGTGHTAFYFANLGAHVFGVDINDEMLAVAQEEAERKSLLCRFTKGFADDLPFDEETFDIVTTRLAAHHFKAPGDFLAEAFRVLRDGGMVLVIDNVVPEGETGAWLNEFEKQRDPTHRACLTVSTWAELLQSNGFGALTLHEYPKALDFDLWMKRMSVVGNNADILWDRLQDAPQSAKAFLKPETSQEGRGLTLHRVVMVARKIPASCASTG